MLCLDVYSDDGKTMTSSTLDYNKIGNCNVEGNRWTINEDGSQKFYSTHSSKKTIFLLATLPYGKKIYQMRNLRVSYNHVAPPTKQFQEEFLLLKAPGWTR